jgi:hypothetical protein
LEPVLHVTHPPHILHRSEDDESDSDSDADTVYTTLEGGAVTEERMMYDSLGKRKRRLIPTASIRVSRRSKEGSAGDIAHDSDDEAADAREDPTDGTDPNLDLDPDLDRAIQMDLDLGEELDLDDPIQDGQAFAPVLGPRPEDILFDLSDESSNGEGPSGTQTPASEAEVWAELEDVEMNEAYTPAGMLGDYEMSDDEESSANAGQEVEDEGLPEGVIDFGYTDAETDAIRQAILHTETAG